MRLSGYERRWTDVVARALFPPGALGGAVDAVQIGSELAADLDDNYPWHGALVCRIALWFVWLSPLLVHRRLRTFGGLPPEERVALLEELLVSPRYLARMFALAVKTSICLVALGTLRALAHLDAHHLGTPPALRLGAKQ
jgi:hypothetical protein